MKYDLAKKLNDARFQWMRGLHRGDELVYPNDEICISLRDEDGGRYDWFRIPTTDELIEALGDKFGRLEAPWAGCPAWVASRHKSFSKPIYARGDTPKEALAHLWLLTNSHA